MSHILRRALSETKGLYLRLDPFRGEEAYDIDEYDIKKNLHKIVKRFRDSEEAHKYFDSLKSRELTESWV